MDMTQPYELQPKSLVNDIFFINRNPQNQDYFTSNESSYGYELFCKNGDSFDQTPIFNGVAVKKEYYLKYKGGGSNDKHFVIIKDPVHTNGKCPYRYKKIKSKYSSYTVEYLVEGNSNWNSNNAIFPVAGEYITLSLRYSVTPQGNLKIQFKNLFPVLPYSIVFNGNIFAKEEDLRFFLNSLPTVAAIGDRIVSVTPDVSFQDIIETEVRAKGWSFRVIESVANSYAATEQQGAMEEPTATEQPSAMEEPTATEQPGAMEEPTVTEQPGAIEEPTATEQPGAMEEPTATEQPGAMEEPTATEQPGAMEEPTATEQPGASE